MNKRLIFILMILISLLVVFPVLSADKYSINNITVVDNNSFTFKIMEAKDDSIWGFTLRVYCENKMPDKTLMFSWDDVSVNGYMIDPFWATEVPAGKKANKDISFSSSSFSKAGISSADEITFTLRVYDSNDWWADDFYKESYTIYPTGASGKNSTTPARKTSKDEKVIIDNDICTFIILEPHEDSIWGYTLDCYLENKTNNKTLIFSWDDVSVNGYMIDPFWATSVPQNLKKYSEISFSTSKFNENYISSVEEIEFNLRIYDDNDWMADDIINQTFKYRP